MTLAPDSELGIYRLTRKLGAGGMGEVWEAEDTRLRRTVAVKILPPSIAGDTESQARFMREARTVAQLYHPNIATIHSIEEASGRTFIVMEHVKGEPLSRLMSRGPLPEAEALQIARQVAAALKEAHEKGIIHRDIKPDNIMVAGDRVKVLDFGIAKQMGLQKMSHSNETTGFVTEAGVIIGTVFYMSPEQALGKQELDGRSDLFSLGVVLYQAVTGRLPFLGETVTETLTLIIRDRHEPVRAANPGVSEGVANLIERCMAKKKEDRFRSAGDLLAAIEVQQAAAPTLKRSEAQREQPRGRPASPTVVTRPPSGQPTEVVSQRTRLPWIVAISLLVAIGAGALIYSTQRSDAPADSTAEVPSVATVTGVDPSVVTTNPSSVQSQTELGGSIEEAIAPVIRDDSVQTDATTGTGAAIPTPDVRENPSSGIDVSSSSLPPSEQGVSANQLYEQGLALLERGNRVGALLAFRGALLKDPQHAPARFKVGQLALANGKKSEAAGQFDKALQGRSRLDPRQAKLAEIGLAVATGDFQRAVELGTQYERQYPGDPEFAQFKAEVQQLKKKEQQQNPPKFPRRRVKPSN